MTVVHAWQGAATPSRVWVRAKVDGATARLAVADSESLSGAVFYGPLSPDAEQMVSFVADGLDPGTRYWWAVEVDGDLDGDWRGTFRTHPAAGDPASYTVAVAGDGGAGGEHVVDRVSNHPVYETIRSRALAGDWLQCFHVGDKHYRGIGSGVHTPGPPFDETQYRQAYDDLLTFNGTLGHESRQGRLWRSLALAYVWNNHDYGYTTGSAIDSDRLLPHRAAARRAYRERVPHYPLPAGEDDNPIYQSVLIGRVLWIMLDQRSERDPNTDTDGPGKTTLGSRQIDWLDDLLASTPAQAVVLISPDNWITRLTESDTWNVYQHERSLVAQMLHDRGFGDRTCVVSGHQHSLGIDTGGNNVAPHGAGGFPYFQFASLDASPASSHDLLDLGPTHPGRGQYGTIEVEDLGHQITITGRGWIGDQLWREHSFTMSATQPPPDVPPAPAPVGRARIRRPVTWHGVHAVSGRIIAELPDVQGEIGRLLSAYHSSPLTLPIPLDGPGHVPIRLVEQATAPVSSALVAVVNDLPAWMGWVLTRKGGTGGEMQLATVTPEGYLRRRRVRDHSFTATDRALIAAELLADAGSMSGVGAGLGFDVDVALTGDLIDREYLASDRQTVYDAMRELAADGLEFTVDLDWLDEDRTSVRKIVRVGPRLGKAESGALFETTASSLFEARSGSEATYELTEDWSAGRGANWIQAYGPGEGEDQPASVPAIDQAALDGGAPIVEHHWQPSTTISDQGDLDRHAAAELARLRRGAELWEIEARWDAYPRLSVDAQLGDDVSWLLHGHRHPDGVMGRGRMVGWRLDQQAGTWRPILLDPQEA